MMMPLLQKRDLMVFFFCLCFLTGASYNTYVHYDFSHSIDSRSYLEMAKGNFSVKAIHRYRVVVPLLAGAVNVPIEKIYDKVWDKRQGSQWSLQLSFFIVNILIMSLAGMYVFKAIRLYQPDLLAATLGLAAVLSSRWAIYSSSLPLTDSLYILVFAITFYALKANNRKLLILSILLGPLAKESYIFLAPFVIVLAWKEKFRILPWFVLSSLIAFGLRVLINHLTADSMATGTEYALSHFALIGTNLLGLFSLHGIGELFTVLGFFSFILLYGFLGNRKRIQSWLFSMDRICFFILISVIIHAVISGAYGRMLFYAAPVYAVAIALVVGREFRKEPE